MKYCARPRPIGEGRPPLMLRELGSYPHAQTVWPWRCGNPARLHAVLLNWLSTLNRQANRLALAYDLKERRDFCCLSSLV